MLILCVRATNSQSQSSAFIVGRHRWGMAFVACLACDILFSAGQLREDTIYFYFTIVVVAHIQGTYTDLIHVCSLDVCVCIDWAHKRLQVWCASTHKYLHTYIVCCGRPFNEEFLEFVLHNFWEKERRARTKCVLTLFCIHPTTTMPIYHSEKLPDCSSSLSTVYPAVIRR